VAGAWGAALARRVPARRERWPRASSHGSERLEVDARAGEGEARDAARGAAADAAHDAALAVGGARGDAAAAHGQLHGRRDDARPRDAGAHDGDRPALECDAGEDAQVGHARAHADDDVLARAAIVERRAARSAAHGAEHRAAAEDRVGVLRNAQVDGHEELGADRLDGDEAAARAPRHAHQHRSARAGLGEPASAPEGAERRRAAEREVRGAAVVDDAVAVLVAVVAELDALAARALARAADHPALAAGAPVAIGVGAVDEAVAVVVVAVAADALGEAARAGAGPGGRARRAAGAAHRPPAVGIGAIDQTVAVLVGAVAAAR